MSWLIWLVVLLTTPWLFPYILWKIRFKRLSKTRVPILAYHQVSDSFDLSITRQKVRQFERGIRFLCEHGYKAVGLNEVLNSGEHNDEKKVVFTFDDAYQDVYVNAFPILQKFAFTACIFVITGYVGKYSEWDYNSGRGKKKHLSWEQMQKMADAGFEFGSHTVNHPDLTKIPKRFVEYELKGSKEILEDQLDRRVNFLSYPFGRYNRYVQEEAQRLGYEGACTLCPNPEGNELSGFSQARWGVYLLDSPLTLMIKLNQGKLFWIEDMKGRIINRFPAWTVVLKGSPNYDKIDVKRQKSQHPKQ
jgi:peptidoglycan/xylan/chitin deacetylase (PgdA/CDA1 family)